MKSFVSTLTGLIVVIILAVVIVGFVFWSRLPDVLADRLSSKLNVAVEIDGLSLGWGKVGVKKIQIGNPPGSILAKAFASSEIDVMAPFTNYMHQHIVIDEIDVNDVYLGLEFDSASGTSGNWTTIMSNLNSTTGNTSSRRKKRQSQEEAPASSSSRTVLIHRLVLTNIDVDVVYRKEGGKVKRLPRIPQIVLTEISSEGGVPLDQIMNSVLGQMLQEVFLKQNLKNMLQNLLENQNPIKQYLNPFKGWFNAHFQEELPSFQVNGKSDT